MVAYYWGPTWILGTYDLVRLEEPAFDPEIWARLRSEDEPTEATAYPLDEVKVAVNAEFAAIAPKITQFLTAYETDAALVSQALAFMQQDGANNSNSAAIHFLRTRTDVWHAWVDDDTRSRVQAALETTEDGS